MVKKTHQKFLTDVVKDSFPKEAVGVPLNIIQSGFGVQITEAQVPSLISRMEIQSSPGSDAH